MRAALVVLLACACTPVDWVEPESEQLPALDDDFVPPVPEEEPPPPRSVREILDLPPPRTHELWPVPVTSACPRVTFGALGPGLTGGDMMHRTAVEFAARPDASVWSVPTEVRLLRHHLDVPGVRLLAALNYSSGCMMGWWAEHCFVTAGAVYCPGDAEATIGRFVRDLQLAPRDLDRAAWLEVVAVLLGVETIVLWPDEIDTCVTQKDARAAEPSVLLLNDRVRVQLTAIVEGAGTLYTVEIHADARVTVDATPLWQPPPDPYD